MHDKGVDDRILLEELSRGNDSAFWSIWEAYRNHLYVVCLRHLRGVHSDAADAASRSMLVARNRLPDYAQQIENLEAWLTRLTCNVCLDIHRERRRESRAGFDLEEAAEEEQGISALAARTPEEDVLQAEACRSITTAIRELPRRLREIAEMRFIEDLDYDVIAGRLDITQENARKRVQQARGILSERLGRGLSLRAVIRSRPTSISAAGLARKR
jgi:RNA polymerase sigma-70 factor (ECF subfamily)